MTAFSCQSVTCAGLRCARVCVMAAHSVWAWAGVVMGNGGASCVCRRLGVWSCWVTLAAEEF